MKRLLFFALLIIVTTPLPTLAHKVNLFCYIENGIVHGEGFFSQGAPVKNASVEMYDVDKNALVGATKTNDDGIFSLPINGAENIKVVLVASMGHRTEYLLTQTATTEKSVEDKTTIAPNQPPLDYEKIAEIVQQEVRPLRDDLRHLEKQQMGPDVGAIVGGLGWIVGIFSLLYLLRKKNAS